MKTSIAAGTVSMLGIEENRVDWAEGLQTSTYELGGFSFCISEVPAPGRGYWLPGLEVIRGVGQPRSQGGAVPRARSG